MDIPVINTKIVGIPKNLDRMAELMPSSILLTHETSGLMKSLFSLWNPAKKYTSIKVIIIIGRIISKKSSSVDKPLE
jgi:hypothetical protein